MMAPEDLLLTHETCDSGDRDLIRRCIEGDQEAWKQLVRRYERLIYSIALRIAATPKPPPMSCSRFVWSSISGWMRFATPQPCPHGLQRSRAENLVITGEVVNRPSPCWMTVPPIQKIFSPILNASIRSSGQWRVCRNA